MKINPLPHTTKKHYRKETVPCWIYKQREKNPSTHAVEHRFKVKYDLHLQHIHWSPSQTHACIALQ